MLLVPLEYQAPLVSLAQEEELAHRALLVPVDQEASVVTQVLLV